MNRSLSYLVALSLFWVPIVASEAQTYPIQNILTPTDSSSIGTQINGASVQEMGLPTSSDSNLGLEFTVNQSALTITFNELAANSLVLPSFSETNDYTTGFYTVVPVTTTLTFNPVQFSTLQQNQFNLKAGTGYSQPTYTLPGTSLSYSIANLNVTGSYSVTGPTSSATGTFSIPVNLTFIVNDILETSGYPNSLVLAPTSAGATFLSLQTSGGSVPLFDTTVNGVTIADTGFSFFQNVSPTVFDLETAPEPSVWALVAAGVAGLIIISRRRIFVSGTSSAP